MNDYFLDFYKQGLAWHGIIVANRFLSRNTCPAVTPHQDRPAMICTDPGNSVDFCPTPDPTGQAVLGQFILNYYLYFSR